MRNKSKNLGAFKLTDIDFGNTLSVDDVNFNNTVDIKVICENQSLFPQY